MYSKRQMLNHLQKEVETMHVGMEQMFAELQQRLLGHPNQAKQVVQSCCEEFNRKSTQLQQMCQKCTLLINELILLRSMLRTRPISENKQFQFLRGTTCTETNVKRKKLVGESSSMTEERSVCGFPIAANVYKHLWIEEPHAESLDPVKNAEIVKTEAEDIPRLKNPRLTRAQRQRNQNIQISKMVNLAPMQSAQDLDILVSA